MNPVAGHLDYEALPPLDVALRFFLVAPMFGLVAGVLLLVDPSMLDSRWTPGAFAAVHLVAVGFILTVMIGALYQILPVLGGGAVAGGRRLAGLVHGGWCVGAVLLCAGLARMHPPWLELAAGVLGTTMVVFVLAAVVGLWRREVSLDAQRDLRLGLVALTCAVALGMLLVMVLARGAALPLAALLDLHVGWALLGGIGLILAATSWVVVPMFHITPPWPARLQAGWGASVLVLLVLGSALRLLDDLPPAVTGLLWLLPALVFVACLLWLEMRSRKATSDPARAGFVAGAVWLGLGLCLAVVAQFLDAPRWSVMAGALILYAGLGGLVEAMLYKIVPFLSWLHLTQAGLRAPNLKQLLPDASMRRQQRLRHGVVVVLVLGAAGVWPGLMLRFAGLGIALEFAWLAWNLLCVVRRYHQVSAGGTGRPKVLARP